MAQIARLPITKAHQLEELDDAEVLEGYLDGFGGEPDAGDNRSFSYWHGYQNGKADRTGKPTEAQRKLVSDVVNSGYLPKLFQKFHGK